MFGYLFGVGHLHHLHTSVERGRLSPFRRINCCSWKSEDHRCSPWKQCPPSSWVKNYDAGAGLSFFHHYMALDWVGPEMVCSPHTTTNRSGRRGGLERDLKWIQFQHELVDPHILTYLRCGGRHHDHKFSKAKVTVIIKAALQSFQTPSGPAPLLRWNGGTWVIWSTYSKSLVKWYLRGLRIISLQNI